MKHARICFEHSKLFVILYIVNIFGGGGGYAIFYPISLQHRHGTTTHHITTVLTTNHYEHTPTASPHHGTPQQHTNVLHNHTSLHLLQHPTTTSTIRLYHVFHHNTTQQSTAPIPVLCVGPFGVEYDTEN